MIANVRKFLSQYREIVQWLPILLIIAIVLFYLIRAFDPRSGLDGFGSLFDFAIEAIKAVGLVTLVWLTKKANFHELTDYDEEDLLRKASYSDGRQSLLILIQDRLTWFALAVFFYFLLY